MASKRKITLLHNYAMAYRFPIFEEIVKNNFDLTVFFAKKKRDKEQSKLEKKYSFKYILLRSISLGKIIINPSLLQNLIQTNTDIYLTIDSPFLISSIIPFFIYAKITKKPIIVWTEESVTGGCLIYSKLDGKGLIKKILRKLITCFLYYYRLFLFKYCDAIIALSKKAKNHVLTFPISKNKIFYGPQIIPPPPLLRSNSPNKKQNKINILFLSFFRKGKGIKDLIQAYKKISTDNTQLIIAGSGPLLTQSKILAQNRTDIFFPGYVSGQKKSDILSQADIFVFPTMRDSWGLVLNEALHYGLPVIVSTAAGSADYLVQDNGILIEPGNTNQLQAALKKLITDHQLRHQMGLKSLKIIKKYNSKTGAKPFFQALESVK